MFTSVLAYIMPDAYNRITLNGAYRRFVKEELRMDFLELAKARYSCRKFSDKPVEEDKIAKILEAAKAAPTGKNLQPFKVWQVKSPEAKEALKAATPCIWGANTFFIVGADKTKAWVRPFDNANFCHVDAAIVATHMMLEIQALGLATTWVGFMDAPKLQAAIPALKDYDLIAMFPVGYAAEDAAPSERHAVRSDDVLGVL